MKFWVNFTWVKCTYWKHLCMLPTSAIFKVYIVTFRYKYIAHIYMKRKNIISRSIHPRLYLRVRFLDITREQIPPFFTSFYKMHTMLSMRDEIIVIVISISSNPRYCVFTRNLYIFTNRIYVVCYCIWVLYIVVYT